MKKLFMILFAIALIFGMAGNATALSYTEEYSGFQGVSEGQSYNFGFNFLSTNDKFGVDTDSSLTLNQDAFDAFGPWISAYLSIDFFSENWSDEHAAITLVAWDDFGDPDETFNVGTIDFNAADCKWGCTTYALTLFFSEAELTAFESLGWGNVNIKAVADNNCLVNNDFAITSVAMHVETAPVPEPGTIILLGFGLLGMVTVGRKRIAKK